MTVRYYEQGKDYLHANLNQFINHYRNGDIIDFPLYHGCNRLNRNGTIKETECNIGYQCIIPTYKRYWKETKDKHKRRHFYWARYMTKTNSRHLFKNKDNFVFNCKLKKYGHLSETPMRYEFYHLQEIRKGILENVLK